MTSICDLFTRAEKHREAGDQAQAEALCRQILDRDPENAGALSFLGSLAQERGQLGTAVNLFRRAIASNPRHADAHHHLGVLLRQEGQVREAMVHSRAAIQACPNHADAHLNLGLLHGKLEELEAAAQAFRRAVQSRPDLALARKNLLVALCKLESQHRGAGRWAEAQQCLDESLRLDPSPHLQFAAATLLPAIYSSVEEIDLWRDRLQNNLQRLQQQGFSVELTSEVPTLFYLAYQGRNDRDLQRAAARLLSAPSFGRQSPLPRLPGSKIHIGFISRFFRNHTIAQLFGGMIARLSRDVFTVTLFSIGKHSDEVAQTLRTQADRFVELSDTDLQDARRRIGEENLDVLFFTDIGMEPIAYALAFSRFAPIQCVTWGHPVTTGIDTIDYFISSQLLEIAEADEHYTERLVRLESLPVYYQQPPLPVPLHGREYFNLPEIGHIYGCPQSLFKLHPEFDEVLGEILRRDKQATLVLLQGMHRSWDELLSQRFARTIPDVIGRVRFLPVLSQDDFLSLLLCCDVLLDPLHFGGGNTSYQALAFGIPIVTLPSSFLKGRITQALYRQMNVLDCVVNDKVEYVEKAVQLACDATYRETIRRRILAANSVLYENPSGVRTLENLLREAVARARAPRSDQSAPAVRAQLFAQALQLEKAGDRVQAEAICRRILDADPTNANALNLLGMLAHQAGKNESAIDFLRGAVDANPEDSMVHYNLGVAYQVLDRMAEAIASYKEALRLNPNHADAHHNLARAFLKQRNRDVARTCFEHAVRLRPEFAEAQHSLGLLLREERELDQALDRFRRAAQLEPGRPVFRSDLANLLTQQGLPEEAFPHYQEAIRIQPAEAAHHSNLGNALILLGRPEEAETACREALRLSPDFANALHNLAITRSLQGHLDEAIALNTEALRHEPGHAGAHNCEALWSLQKGDFEHGWREYKWRWDIPNAFRRDFAQPLWDGSSLEGKTILLHAEQGLGDTLQFIRYAPLVKERGGTVIVEAQIARLVEILHHCPGVDQVVARGAEMPKFDVHSPLLELPRIFRTTLATIPAQVPYLFAEPHLIEYWQRELGQGEALKIGIAWQGNAHFPGDRLRSIPLQEFAPLARCDGLRLFSLQQAEGRGQVAEVRDQFHVNDLAGRLDASAAFVDTAAVMRNLDLVITSDTAIAHLAGALGVPVWVALGVGADWRWLEKCEDCPWYPTMRLFRQKHLRDWPDVLERMAAALPARGRAPSPAAVAKLWGQTLDHFHARRLVEAEQACAQLLAVEPCHADAVNLQGMLRHQAGDQETACERLRHAIHLSPDNAGFHYHLGVALHVLGKLEDAAASYRAAIERQPDHADAHHNWAMILRQRGKIDDAVSEFRSAVQARPDHAEAHHNLGLALIAAGKLEEAVRHFRAAIAARPDHVGALHNLGLALVGLGRSDEALAAFDRVLASDARAAETRFCRSMILLQKGDFAQGWTEYEWRWQSHNASRGPLEQSFWDGSPLTGKTIFLHAEQGLGDTLQFIRYALLVKQQGGTVVVECQAALVPLLSRCRGIDRLVPAGEATPPIDVQAPLLSLPRIFRTDLSTVPAEVPYLHIDARLAEDWREKLLAIAARNADNPAIPFKVGIAWQGDANYLWDRWRSIPLTAFGRLASVPGIQLISLQVGKGRQQLSEVRDRFPVIDPGEQRDQHAGAFMDTAAIMKSLDLVIASDSAVAHLAGALGVPVWVPLCYSADWRWLMGREDSPWYPTMRLFRQARLGDWEEVFERIAAALQEKLASAARAEAASRLLRSAVENIQSGRAEEARRSLDELLAVATDHPDALNLLGILAHQAGRPAEAAQLIRRAVHARPADATFRYNLAVAEHVQGKLDAAIASYQETLRLQPSHADTCNNLGFALAEINRTEEALAFYARALQLRPEYAEAYSNAGLALAVLGKYEEALHHCDQALRIAPNHADAHLARAALLLLQGDYERGWEEYEWRWKPGPMASRGIGPGVPSLTTPAFSQPLWDGSPLEGRTILLYAEQGYGDTLQFIRYAPLVKERGGTVLVECQGRLERLLGRCRGIDTLVASGSPLPSFDVRAPLLSLPRILKTTLATVPAEVPYLFPDPGLMESWNCALGDLSGIKIGIAWSCDRRFDWGGRRSVALQQFAPLGAVPGVRLISLQKGEAAEEVRRLAGEFEVTDFASLDEAAGPFMDTAALMKSLDLVIAVDTSLAHLAGALGVPVWIALPHVPDWRWLLERENSPWYPTARLFRQSRPGEWDDVFQRIAAELRRFLGHSVHSGPLKAEIAPGELVDKITILGIKRDRITDAAKLHNVLTELRTLNAARAEGVPSSERLTTLTAELKNVNERLWEIEDEIRVCELNQDFGSRFIELARSAYQQNDRRAALKRQINELLGSKLIEEKVYVDYRRAPASERRATICILTYGDYLPYFRRCLDSVLAHTPLDQIELRLGINDAAGSFAWTRRRLAGARFPREQVTLPGDIQRITFTTDRGMTVRLWNSPINLYKEPMARLLYHDVSLDTEYAVWFDDDSHVEAGWWRALGELFQQKIDYIGQTWWVDYLPGQWSMIQAQPWYRAVPAELREGKPGVHFMTGGFLAVRSERLREANFPDTSVTWKNDQLKQYGGDTLLGEIARQLGWTRAIHHAHIKVNMDLEGKHPAPRRGGAGKQFGSDVDAVIV